MTRLALLLLLGQSFVQDVPCRQPKDSVTVLDVLVDGGTHYPVPLTPLAGRRFIEICWSDKNASTAVFTCRIDADGGVPTTSMFSPGATLSSTTKCKGYTIPSTQVIKCITNLSDAGITSQECK